MRQTSKFTGDAFRISFLNIEHKNSYTHMAYIATLGDMNHEL
jgi:hypothetical protein